MEIRRSALLEFSAEEMFDVIEKAEHYPAFLPGCESVTILERSDSIVAARVAVGWRGLRFEFTTRNPKHRPEWLAVRLVRGREAPAEARGREAPAESRGREAPAEWNAWTLKRLDGEWHIRPLSPQSCKVEFTLHCELEGAIASKVAGALLDPAADMLMNAYVARAQALHYSQPS